MLLKTVQSIRKLSDTYLTAFEKLMQQRQQIKIQSPHVLIFSLIAKRSGQESCQHRAANVTFLV